MFLECKPLGLLVYGAANLKVCTPKYSFCSRVCYDMSKLPSFDRSGKIVGCYYYPPLCLNFKPNYHSSWLSKRYHFFNRPTTNWTL